MAGLTDLDVYNMESDALVIFCCKADVERALMSGLVGTLQGWGYRPEIQQAIAEAFLVALDTCRRDGVWDDQHLAHGQLGTTVYLGVCHIFDFAGFNTMSLADKVATARNVHQRFRDLPLSIPAATFAAAGVHDHTPQSEEAREAMEQEAREGRGQAVESHGGPWGYVPLSNRTHIFHN
ncbi:hypothetical protein LTR27_002224 [Elasticomyces elasticus]|nr:hypothetical protein LTR27_002224 [Elasticomyces elasticus]